MSRGGELYACVLVREFPAQALLRLRPKMRDCACVVMDGDPPMEQVCSMNDQARAAGIRDGMTRAEVDTFSGVAILHRSMQDEIAAKAVLLECAGGFSPRVEDCCEDGSFACVIDIAGTDKLFGPADRLAKTLAERTAALGLAARVAVCGNYHASIALAKGLTQDVQVCVIAVGEERAALASLPLAVLELTEEQRETFSLWGIRTLGMLAALPETELIARMGQAGKRLREQARGTMDHLLRPVEPAFTLEERMELDAPVDVLDGLLFIVNVMLEQLTARAASRALALASVTVTLALEGGASHARTVRPALATNDRRLWIKLLQLDLDAHPPNAAVLSVTVGAEPGETSKVQLGLFSPQLPEASRLDVTLARISSIVGDEQAGRAVLMDTHAPEGYRMEPFTVASAESSASSSEFSRPMLRMIRPAEGIVVALRNHRPQSFAFRTKRYVVERAYGPWHSSGEWWRPTLWGREEWDLVARAEDGAMLCCCLIRDRMREVWQIEALYD